MRQTNESSFGVDLVDPTQKKPAEPTNSFDLPEDRFHDFLALGVGGAPFNRPQFPLHPFFHRGPLRDAAPRRGRLARPPTRSATAGKQKPTVGEAANACLPSTACALYGIPLEPHPSRPRTAFATPHPNTTPCYGDITRLRLDEERLWPAGSVVLQRRSPSLLLAAGAQVGISDAAILSACPHAAPRTPAAGN